MPKKLPLPAEVTYLLAIVIMAFSVAMVTAADFGVSMIVAPAYILSQALEITFGQGEYIIQGIAFILFCIVMKKLKIAYFGAFITGLLYGAVLDFWRSVIPAFSPEVIAAGSLSMPVRILFFLAGECLTGISVALFFKTYLYPQVYDFFVKGITEQYQLNRTKFKIGFDCSMLVLSLLMTFLIFHKLVGVGIGTLIMCAVNGVLIGFFDRLLNKCFRFPALFPKAEQYFMKQITPVDKKQGD